jgi:tRNA-binding protein
MATIEEFHKLDIRVGKVISVERVVGAKKPAYKMKIDFGKLGIKNSSAQLTGLYSKEDLLGRQVVAVVNFPPRQIANFVSEVLILGAISDKRDTILLVPERDAEPGDKIA